MLKLYYAPGVCSLSPHIVLHEAGLAAETIRVDLATHTLADGSDFRTINPRGYVPVLELDDGERLTEGPAIVQYLADLAPASGLAPAQGSFARYRLQEWLGFINSELHKTFSPLFDPVTESGMQARLREKIAHRLEWTAGQLGDRPFLLGETFTAADAYLFTILGWLKPLGMSLGDWPVLAAYHARIGQRPAVREALRAEGLLR